MLKVNPHIRQKPHTMKDKKKYKECDSGSYEDEGALNICVPGESESQDGSWTELDIVDTSFDMSTSTNESLDLAEHQIEEKSQIQKHKSDDVSSLLRKKISDSEKSVNVIDNKRNSENTGDENIDKNKLKRVSLLSFKVPQEVLSKAISETLMSHQQIEKGLKKDGEKNLTEIKEEVIDELLDEDGEKNLTEIKEEVRDEAYDSKEENEQTEDEVFLVYHCWICAEEFNEKRSIVIHLKSCHSDRPELKGIENKMKTKVCVVAECPGVNCEHIEQTIKSEPEQQLLLYPCADCSRSFHSQSQLQKHRTREHQGGKNFQCSFCPSKFISHSHLMAHARSHTNYRPHLCKVCGSRFHRRSDLDRHSRTHTGEKPYACAQCDKTFSQRCSLEKHCTIHAKLHGGLACQTCGLVFPSANALANHTRSEHQERRWSCHVCNKAFSARHYLSLHMKTHNKSRQFPCKFCGKSFRHHTLKVKHEERIHMNKREIKCEICQKVFQRTENLNRHMRTHRPDKEFTCPECGQGFTEKGSMKRHFASRHQNHKPHSCSVCGKAFTRKFLLKKHTEKLHPHMDVEIKQEVEEEEEKERVIVGVENCEREGEQIKEEVEEESVKYHNGEENKKEKGLEDSEREGEEMKDNGRLKRGVGEVEQKNKEIEKRGVGLKKGEAGREKDIEYLEKDGYNEGEIGSIIASHSIEGEEGSPVKKRKENTEDFVT